MTRTRLCVGAGVVIAALTAPPVPASLVWDVQDTGLTGFYVSLKLDANLRPHFTYADPAMDYALRYARWDGTSWQSETVDSRSSSVGSNSLALDSQGRPWISYSVGSQLQLAQWTGSAWSIQDVKYGVSSGASLQLDSVDRPHIAYTYNQQPEYARWDGTAWQSQIVDTATVSGGPRLLLDSQERPHLGYAALTETSNYCAKYAVWHGSTWDIETVAGGSGAGDAYLSAFTLNSSDEPRMLYSVNDGLPGEYYRLLKYAARGAEGTWQTRDVKRVWGSIGGYLAMTAGDSPRVAYYGEYVSSPTYMAWNGSGWDTEVIEEDGGRCYALALDPWDYPHVMYASQSVSPFHLKYASGHDPLAVRWPR